MRLAAIAAALTLAVAAPAAGAHSHRRRAHRADRSADAHPHRRRAHRADRSPDAVVRRPETIADVIARFGRDLGLGVRAAQTISRKTHALVSMHNVNSGENALFVLPRDGIVGAAEAAAIAHYFRCRRTGREHKIAAGELAILARLADHYPGHTIDLISGYRAPPFGVPHSKHFTGHAIDLRVEGVPTWKVRNYLWVANHHVGVGYYIRENFIHVDYRPGERDAAWTCRRPGATYHYHPRWARRARARARASRVGL